MSDRIVKHSNRYTGPAGDSRPTAEIFAGIEARTQQAGPFMQRLIFAMDDIMENMTLTSTHGRADMIRDIMIDWLYEHHPDYAGKEK